MPNFHWAGGVLFTCDCCNTWKGKFTFKCCCCSWCGCVFLPVLYASHPPPPPPSLYFPPSNTSFLLTLITPYSPLPSSTTQQPSSVCISLINTYGRLISLLLLLFSQDLGDLRTLTIILTCVKHHQYEVSRQNHFAKSYRLLHVQYLFYSPW